MRQDEIHLATPGPESVAPSGRVLIMGGAPPEKLNDFARETSGVSSGISIKSQHREGSSISADSIPMTSPRAMVALARQIFY